MHHFIHMVPMVPASPRNVAQSDKLRDLAVTLIRNTGAAAPPIRRGRPAIGSPQPGLLIADH